MQKYLNILGGVGFLLAAANTTLIVIAVVRGPAMVEKAFSEIELKMTTVLFDRLDSSVTEAMPSQVKEMMPSTTGPAIPF
jgi:hypothetical protein